MKDAATLLQQALNLHQTGQFDLAEQLYRDVLAADRRNVDAAYLLGVLKLHTGRIDDAIAQLTAARKLKRNDLRIALDLGNAYEAKGALREAETCFREVVAMEPQFPGGHFNLGNLLYRTDRFEDASACFRKVLALQPDVLDACVNLGNAELALDHIDQAEAAYRRALSLAPEIPDLSVNVANVIFRKGRYDEAEKIYRRVLEQDPDNGTAHYNIGLITEQRGDMTGARPHFEKAVRAKPELAEAWFHLGTALQQEPTEWNAAADCFVRAGNLRQHDPDWAMGIGRSLAAIGEYALAENCFRRALPDRPDDAELYYWMGRCLNALERFEEAERYARQALELKSDFHLTLLNLADSQFGLGRPEDALPYAKRALELDPNNPDCMARMGRYYMQRGDTDRASYWFKRTLEVKPDYPNSEFEVGLCALLSGHFTEGWHAFAMMNRKAVSLVNQSVELTSPIELPPDVNGKIIEIKADQGVGDELFILRFAKALRERGASVYYRATEKVHALLKDRPGIVDRVYGRDEKDVKFDESIRLTALPHALNRIDAEPMPARSARVKRRVRAPSPSIQAVLDMPVWRRVYWPLPATALPLTPRAALVERYRSILAKLGEPPYIGVTWRAGGVKDTELAKGAMSLLSKNVPVEALAKALRNVKGTIVVLQRLPAAGEIARFSEAAGRTAHDFTDANEDLEDMMGLLAVIDDYVGVSNTNMHLAVSIGKTARVLVPMPPEWRWMARGRTSPWFPGFTVYRQRPETGWTEALAQVTCDLQETFGKRES